MKILLSEDGPFLIREKSDLNTHLGIIKWNSIKSSKVGDIIRTHTNKPLLLTTPSNEDFVRLMSRGPQIMTLKDIGIIISYASINKNSKILDIGTGSGTVAIVLATIAKKVVTVDINKEYQKIATENAKIMGVKNIEFLNDIKEVKEKEFDVAIIDIPSPSEVFKKVYELVRRGGYIVVYLPNISQVEKLIRRIGMSARVEQIVDISWNVDGDKIARPKNMQLYHTGFLSFFRKIF
jgi:tRNA A58 N-methylase Trm61